MKRFVVVAVALGLTVASLGTAEAKKKPPRVERTFEGSYETPFVPGRAGCSRTDGHGCVTVYTRSTESFFTARVTDTHGLPVFVQVWEDTDGWGNEDVLHGTFCGETTEPISFPPGTELHFWVGFTYSRAAYESCPGGLTATTGTVTVTLSNVPESQPVRSGKIVSGVYTTGPMGGCEWMPDCRAWLESDCNSVLTGHDPAWLSSIEDVADLSDGRTKRVFEWGAAEPVGLRMGGIVVQFWNADCTEIKSGDWYSWEDSHGPQCCSSKLRTVLKVPVAAKWMTVSGSTDNLHVAWTLT